MAKYRKTGILERRAIQGVENLPPVANDDAVAAFIGEAFTFNWRGNDNNTEEGKFTLGT